MPKYFCEYCGIYLTHSSPGGRYQHSHGRKHINNKIEYYSQFLTDFQQNTFNNLLTLATKFANKPKSNDNIEEQDIEINIDQNEGKENCENKENNDKENLNEIKEEEDENNKSVENENKESNK